MCDELDLLELGRGGAVHAALGALVAPARAAPGEMVKCYVQREGSTRFDLFTEGGEYLLTARQVPPPARLPGAGLLAGPLDATAVGEELFVLSQFREPSAQRLAVVRFGGAGSERKSGASFEALVGGVSIASIQHNADGNDPLCLMSAHVPETLPALGTPEAAAGLDGAAAEADGGAAPRSVALPTKLPAWSEKLQSYTLDYRGRAKMASSRNFQLEGQEPEQPKGQQQPGGVRVALQYGKVDDNRFNLDFTEPLCAVSAFAIALTTVYWS